MKEKIEMKRKIVKKIIAGVSVCTCIMGVVAPQTIEARELYRVNGQINQVSQNNNDLLYYNSSSRYGIMIDEIVAEIKTLSKNMSEIRVEQNVNKIIAEKYSDTGLENYITKRLNEEEKKLYKKNRAKALLCMSEGVLAIKTAERNYETYVLYNGNGDAFRHTIWCFGMVYDVGETFAKKWSDAHENGDKVQPSIVKNMDIYNNKIGLKLGKDYPNIKTPAGMIKKAKVQVSNGKCRRIVADALVKTNKEGLKDK